MQPKGRLLSTYEYSHSTAHTTAHSTNNFTTILLLILQPILPLILLQRIRQKVNSHKWIKFSEVKDRRRLSEDSHPLMLSVLHNLLTDVQEVIDIRNQLS